MIAIAMYLANLQGTPVPDIASAVDMPINWVSERIEAGRLCVEHQVAGLEFSLAE